MRWVGVLLFLVVACGDEPKPAPEPEQPTAERWPSDGFLKLVPARTSVTLRLPPTDASENAKGLWTALGRSADDAYLVTDGLDGSRAGAITLGIDRSWLRFLPAADKGTVNAGLRAQAGRLAVREEGDWVVVGTGATPAPQAAEPLPPGDLAIRVRNHALLDAIAQPGDQLDLGIKLEPAGLTARGRLIPAANSPTVRAFANAGGALYGRVDLLPAWMAIRVETSLPPTLVARHAARRIGVQCGLEEGELRDNVERFLREAATALDPTASYCLGIDCKDGELAFAIVGRIAEGPASPILAQLGQRDRHSFGGLTLDKRDVKSKKMRGFYAWVPQANATPDGLPNTAVGMLANLVDEEMGVSIAFVETEGFAILTAGKTADTLARSIQRRVESGMKMSSGGRTIASMQQTTEGECVWAAVVSARRLAGLAAGDIAALREMFFAGDTATAPKLITAAAFRQKDAIAVRAQVEY